MIHNISLIQMFRKDDDEKSSLIKLWMWYEILKQPTKFILGIKQTLITTLSLYCSETSTHWNQVDNKLTKNNHKSYS